MDNKSVNDLHLYNSNTIYTAICTYMHNIGNILIQFCIPN